MKYLVKKTIPLIDSPLKSGDIIDTMDHKYALLNFNDSNFFEKYHDPKYIVGQKLIYMRMLCTVKRIITPTTFEILHEGAGKRYTISDKAKTTNVTEFWFINSNGKICPDYEERSGILLTGLRYKKRTGNYFLSKEEAKTHLDKLLSQCK